MENHKELINDLANCVEACENCISGCLNESDVEAMTACIQTDRDCADICSLASRFLARDSKQAIQLVGICATMCAECAEECEKHDHDHCVKCAEACRRCEESCKAYLNQ